MEEPAISVAGVQTSYDISSRRRTLMIRFAQLWLTALAALVLGVGGALAICTCGDSTCGGVTCVPPETSQTCPEDCGHLPPPPTYTYDLRAIAKIDGAVIPLPKPMYFTDLYMGVWNELDLSQHPGLDLGTKIYYIPNQHPGPYFIGPYSSDNFGSRETVRRKLQIIKDAGLYPAIHILSRHLIDASFRRVDWNDYGAKVDGVMKYSYDLFLDLYMPILKEMGLPYILIYDMWAFNEWPPANIPNQTYDRLFWNELEELHWFVTKDMYKDSQTDLHIRLRQYTPNFALNAYLSAIYIFGAYNKREEDFLLDDSPCTDLRIQVLKALGAPGGTGRNPYNGKWGNYHGFFWIHWDDFTPDVRACPGIGDLGLWNMVSTSQCTTEPDSTRLDRCSVFAEAKKRDDWVDSDKVGPRYFYGYIPHFHDKRSVNPPRHSSISGTDEEASFLTYQAAQKGMVFTGVWNEYGEGMVMEPANNVGSPADEHPAWVNNIPVFLDNFKDRRLDVKQPPELLSCPSGQYVAWYFNNLELSERPTVTRCETDLKHSWGAGGPGGRVGNDSFSARWTGRFNFEGRTYTFVARTDDGIRVWLDEDLIIESWRDQGVAEKSAVQIVTPGEHTIKVEYYEHSGGAIAEFSWR